MVTVARQPGRYIKQRLVAVCHFSEFLPASSVSSRYVTVLRTKNLFFLEANFSITVFFLIMGQSNTENTCKPPVLKRT